MNKQEMSELATREGNDLFQLAAAMAKSGFYDDVKDQAQAVVKIVQGRELGFGPATSMAGVHIIKGKPSVGAGLIAAAIKGSSRYDYRITEHTAQACTIELYQRRGDAWELVATERFTMEDAKQAGILGSANWQKYPRNMLFARCISNVGRFHCPEVTNGVYSLDEMGAEVDEQGNLITPPAPTVTVIEGSSGSITVPGQKQDEHWIADPKTRRRFWAWARERGLSDDQVHEALGVESLYDFPGDKRAAVAQINAWVEEQIEAATEERLFEEADDE